MADACRTSLCPTRLTNMTCNGYRNAERGNLRTRRTGTRQEAHRHIAMAITMYRDMEMPFWLDQAEVEMRRLRQ